jgi:hypothetical protein
MKVKVIVTPRLCSIRKARRCAGDAHQVSAARDVRIGLPGD